MMLDRIVEVFCEVDDFCQAFLPQWEASLLGTGGPAPRGPHVDQRDHHAAAHSSGFKHLKSFYHGFAEPLLRGSFPGMPCYEHFVSLQKSVFVPLVVFLLSHLGTGLYYIDSTALATIIALAGTRFLPVWPSAARWAGSSASSCTSSSTPTMRSSP
jgi:hypothetical protein